MIPARIRLTNFLTFATGPNGKPVEIDFEGVALWSVAGPNGAGKSAIFDAIDYALYGEHRGGKQHDGLLVRKGATTAKVEFEFTQVGVRYRIERSITLKVGRQGQARSDAKHVQASLWDDDEQLWVAIPDTDRSTDLERWVRRTLGMTANTFRSAVLLRQGEADKLLNVKASARFDILAGLIDLGAYKTLEELATERRRTEEAKVDNLEVQLAGIEDVSAETVQAAAALLKETSNLVASAEQNHRGRQRRLDGAGTYKRLSDEHTKSAERKTALQLIVAEASHIRAQALRRQILQKIINPVTQALSNLSAADNAYAPSKTACEQADGIDLAKLEDAATQLESASGALDAELVAAQEDFAQLQTLFGHGEALHRCRTDLAEREQSLQQLGDPAQLNQETEQLGQELESLNKQREALREQNGKCIDLKGRAQNRLEQAENRVFSLGGLSAEAKCTRCGQSITQEHLQTERREAAFEVEQAKSQLTEAEAAIAKIGEEDTTVAQLANLLASRHRSALSQEQAATVAADEVRRAQQRLTAEIKRIGAPDPSWAHADLLKLVTTATLPEAEDAYANLDAANQAVKAKVRQADATARRVRKDAAASRSDHTQAQLKATKLRSEFERQTEIAAQCRTQAQAWLEDVPIGLAASVLERRDAALTELKTEMDALADAANQLDKLLAAESEFQTVTEKLSWVAAELGAIPTDHQVSVEDATADLDAAEEALNLAVDRRNEARDEHVRLKDALEARTQLLDRLSGARRSALAAKRLAGLLGKSELQGRLVADATTGVEAYANDTLGRISGGTLTLGLRNEQTTSLDIFVEDRSSATEPLEVAFISGSQKFRVAVALAVGLGQYIGGRTAIRSLIIDEGFGSLDSDGRQRMIEELHVLSEILDRVIVVSHQEDFADRTLFPNSYVLRKDGTQTTVEHVG